MMRLHKSKSLPELTDVKVSDFEFLSLARSHVEKGSSRSNSTTPKNIGAMSANQNFTKPKRSATKRWKILRRLTFTTTRKQGEDKSDTSKVGSPKKGAEKKKRFSFRNVQNNSSETQYEVNSNLSDADGGTKSTQKSKKKKKLIWCDEESSCSSASFAEISGQEMCDEGADWERPGTPDKSIPRRAGVCEEIEKNVMNEGTSLHELRKDLTVYLTLDELGML